ncbi:thiol:disulfide interchange protein DsbA/DsbL [Rheinheimera sp. UJ51]|uniref:thiol:disulfide interchange protein DsbA/DsbL n=1 Tax=unclassified Rheinheimera TaxID=115860 RepID=UPI001E321B95|nr:MULTISPECIES: thiol:disulfide interchange protein DsbA/DsbL [unclassified Rheinheimera]MCC5452373.1 thiol:disulfide interchange protein DsbA/DsbL [Rheinheimera sp. UJ51]MCF4008853.1 thiol:disulfide interchange protein DsbA/DsbL [Rheinheimera sp. UJ63]
MKKWLVAAVAAVLFPLSAFANNYEEGKHYEVISEQKTAKPEVKEYFSFYCGGCYAFEPIAQSLAKNLPAGTEFKKSHVDFIRAASPEIQNALARAYISAKNLGKGDEMATAIFNQIHKSRVPFRAEDDVRSLALINDIDAETFDKAMRSFPVRGAVGQMAREQEQLSESRVLTGVPMLVVNGKYKINNQNLDQRNLQTDMQNLIEFLLKKD